MAVSANAQKIKAFNTKATQQQQSAMGGQQSQPQPQQTVTPVVTPSASMGVGDIQLLMADPSTLSQEQLLRRDALATKENLKKADELKKKQEADARAQALRERNARKVVTGELQNAITTGMDATTPVGRWLEARPKPGGIATLLIIIAVFLLAIVPVNSNGDTRLKLIWLTLTGKTYIDYSQSGSTIQTSSDALAQSYQASLPASQQPYVPPVNVTVPGYTPGIGNAISGMFGLTEL
jgi:hypothetical protein